MAHDQNTRRKSPGTAIPKSDHKIEEKNIQFITPHYGNRGDPEPLDLSKLTLGSGDSQNPEFEDDEDHTAEDDDEMDEEEEERFTRGRSRSRSVHSNDADGGNHTYSAHNSDPNSSGGSQIPTYTPPTLNLDPNNSNNSNNNNKNNNNNTLERTGPLQHREVVALQKGLEEAQQSLSKTSHAREDEEERMAADAEKRKRLLAANTSYLNATSHAHTMGGGGGGTSSMGGGGGHMIATPPPPPLANNTEPFRRFKILLLGDSAVGKSSLILRWTLDTFNPSLTSTVGVNFKSKKVHYHHEWMTIQVWDTAGQENFHKITTSYYKGAQGIMLVYDVTSKKTLENVEYWIKNIKKHANDSVQIVLVGNKIDLRAAAANSNSSVASSAAAAPIAAAGSSSNSSSVASSPSPAPSGGGMVDTERGIEVAKRFQIPFFETSAKESSHVDEAFMTLVASIVDSTIGGMGTGGGGTIASGAGGAGAAGGGYQLHLSPGLLTAPSASSSSSTPSLSASPSTVAAPTTTTTSTAKHRMFGGSKANKNNQQQQGNNGNGPQDKIGAVGSTPDEKCQIS